METTTLSNPLNISAQVKGPGAVETELVIAGFFVHEPGEPELISGAKQLNDGLKGLVMKLRTNGTFSGEVGATYLFTTPEDTIPAKNVMLLGYGEKSTFTLEKVKTVGAIALRHAVANSFHDVAWAPEVRDARVITFPAGDVAQAFVEGVMNEYKALKLKGEDVRITTFKVLAGMPHEQDAAKGIKAALAKAQS